MEIKQLREATTRLSNLSEEEVLKLYTSDQNQAPITFNDLKKVIEQVASLNREELTRVFAVAQKHVQQIRRKVNSYYDASVIDRHSQNKVKADTNWADYQFHSQELRKAEALRFFIRTIYENSTVKYGTGPLSLPPDV